MSMHKHRKNKPKRRPKIHNSSVPSIPPVTSIPGKMLSLHMSYIPAEPLSGYDAFAAMLGQEERSKAAMDVIYSDLEKYAPMITQGVKFEVIPEMWVNVDAAQAAWNRAEVARFIS